MILGLITESDYTTSGKGIPIEEDSGNVLGEVGTILGIPNKEERLPGNQDDGVYFLIFTTPILDGSLHGSLPR